MKYYEVCYYILTHLNRKLWTLFKYTVFLYACH